MIRVNVRLTVGPGEDQTHIAALIPTLTGVLKNTHGQKQRTTHCFFTCHLVTWEGELTSPQRWKGLVG